MGMFDTVHFTCPHCGETIEDQSKGGPCQMSDYDAEYGVPADVAGGIIGDQIACSGCGRVWIVALPGVVPSRVMLTLVPEHAADYESNEDNRSITLDES
jgi:hypothetical protein